ncbi:MAG TPA: response regulator [Terriglobales bacterium]|nr:response regulator [Terriglobales bacterium]
MATTPTVFFIDDSATMREVIKIAFRRENINVVAYNDAASALGQIETSPPDVVITDVIMPDKDGYEVCQFIKQHPTLGNTPVILMSGVVNRTVAEKAFSVKADELIRKPFQPQDLITRVRHLLHLGGVPAPVPNQAAAVNAAAALSSIFQMPATAAAPMAAPMAAPRIPSHRPPMPAASAQFAQPVYAPPAPAARPAPPVVAPPAAAAAVAPAPPAMPAPPPRSAMSGSGDISKLRLEVMRLEGLVKKLQSELQAEREYAKALEEHVKTLQEAE